MLSKVAWHTPPVGLATGPGDMPGAEVHKDCRDLQTSAGSNSPSGAPAQQLEVHFLEQDEEAVLAGAAAGGPDAAVGHDAPLEVALQPHLASAPVRDCATDGHGEVGRRHNSGSPEVRPLGVPRCMEMHNPLP